MKRFLSLFLAMLLIFAVCSCNGKGGDTKTTETDTEALEEGGYRYPKLDFKGENITVSNLGTRGKTHMYFTVDAENTSDTLDAALWESNQRIEQMFNFKLVEDQFPRGSWDEMWIDHANHMIRNFTSGDDVYDFVFYAVNQRPDLISSGYLQDLSDYEALQLDQPWWDTKLNEDLTINDRLYMTSGPINLMAYDSMPCLIFNKELIAANQLENPYDMVRDGSWTLDKLFELATAIKSAGTEGNFTIPSGQGGTSVFGVGMHRDYPTYFLTSAGISFVEENNGEYDLALSSDDFYLALDKIKPLFTHCHKGGVGGGDASSSEYSRMKFFQEGRVGFCMISTIEAFDMRDTEIEFGFLPLPKLRAEQEDYITTIEERCSFLCIPTTSENPEDVTAMLDALAYDRYVNVVPVYYDSYVTYKGLRDEDSFEMLEIMTAGRTMDIGIAYGLCTELVVQDIAWNFPSDSIASVIATKEGSVNDAIDDFIGEHFN